MAACAGAALGVGGVPSPPVGAADRWAAPPALAAANETEAVGARTPMRGVSACAPPFLLPLGGFAVCRRGALGWLRWPFAPRFPGCVLIRRLPFRSRIFACASGIVWRRVTDGAKVVVSYPNTRPVGALAVVSSQSYQGQAASIQRTPGGLLDARTGRSLREPHRSSRHRIGRRREGTWRTARNWRWDRSAARRRLHTQNEHRTGEAAPVLWVGWDWCISG